MLQERTWHIPEITSFFHRESKKSHYQVGNLEGNLENYTWDKENCVRQLNSSLEANINFSQLTRIFNLKNKEDKKHKPLPIKNDSYFTCKNLENILIKKNGESKNIDCTFLRNFFRTFHRLNGII